MVEIQSRLFDCTVSHITRTSVKQLINDESRATKPTVEPVTLPDQGTMFSREPLVAILARNNLFERSKSLHCKRNIRL